ncbi:MAG TPA: YbaK/EbsC family protein [Spirochaetota bacterium]|jgi:Ala-tRNA(Pro) deacylase|nr:YbaK/EbsC family protein [Spirochaetota bacterium]HPV42893.1 YbaK/EbsC family protein [Spirochaetota bacterium]
MRGDKLKEYLRKNNVPFEVIRHPIAYSSTQTAHMAHIHGYEMAKPVMVKVNGKLIMVVMTANQKVNLSLLKALYETQDVVLASETEFVGKFDDCEMGAEPPFGNLYGIDEVISDDLTRDEDIFFNAGTHTELIKMKYKDFERLVHPRIINFKFKL